MRRYGQIGWRLAAIAAFIGTAALAVVLTRAPGNAVGALSADLTGRACVASGPEAWLGQGAAAGAAGVGVSRGGGTFYTLYTLKFTNVSRQACRLYGYPEGSAHDRPIAGETRRAAGSAGPPSVTPPSAPGR